MKALPQRALLPVTALAASLLALLSPVGSHEPQVAAQSGRSWRVTGVRSPSFDTASLLDPGGVDGGPGGRVYVADTGHHRVAIIDGSGTLVDSFGSAGHGPGDLAGPSDVAVDALRGRVYVVDRGNKRLALFDIAGQALGSWTSAGPEFAFVPLAVAVDPASGDVFALSSSLVPRVERFAADGTWITGWGSLGLGTGQFISPVDLDVHSDGRVLVADGGSGRIQLFDAGGGSQGQWSGLLGVASVSVDPTTGRVFALAGSTADRIVVVSATGRIESTTVSRNLPAAAAFHPGRGLAVTGNGRLAITTGFGANGGGHGLRQLEVSGLALAAATVADPGQHAGFVAPAALDVGADGLLRVLDEPVRLAKTYDADGLLAARADSGVAQEITVGPGGEVYLAEVERFVRLRRLSAAGQWEWDKACDCLSGMGLAANGERVFATDAMSVAIQAFDLDPAREMPVARFGLQDPPYLWPLDLDIGPDGNVWALDALEPRVQVVDPAIGIVLRSFSLRGRGDRISVAPDGTVFVLQLDGSVAAIKPDGRLEAVWPVAPVAGADMSRPQDLAAGPGGRLYVLDGATHAIIVYDADTGLATPTPGPTPESPCTARGDKSASPRRITLADTAAVTLTLDVTCQGDTGTQADIVLILDRSSSMAGAGCSKLCEAQAAAKSFVADLDLARHRVAVVSFSEVATLDLGLTDDRAAVDAAIDAILPAGNTSIGGALELAGTHVAAGGRPGALPVFLLLTDGEPSGSEQSFVASVREALRVREGGGLVYTIGLGANVNADLLTAMAGSPERYFFAPGPADLAPIYARLSMSIGGIVASGLVVDDAMGPDVSYVPGSASGSPSVQGNSLTWDFGAVPSAGITVTYRVSPGRLGRLPTNARAQARYEVAGAQYTFPFPVPVIDVVAVSTATPTPTSAPPTPTRAPAGAGVAYLPLTMNGVCLARDRHRGADIVLVVDTSSSMRGAKLEAALAAGQAFIDAVDPRRDRVGVVAFDASARLVYVISAELAAVRQALADLSTGYGTRVDRGLEAAVTELGYRGRPGSPAVFVVLSDGRPTAGTEAAALAAASGARGSGVTIFAIGLGADADPTFLRAIAARADHYLFAPEAEDLTDLYREVAGRLPCR